MPIPNKFSNADVLHPGFGSAQKSKFGATVQQQVCCLQFVFLREGRDVKAAKRMDSNARQPLFGQTLP